MPAEVLEKSVAGENAVRNVSKVKSNVKHAVGEALDSARYAMRYGRYTAEDVIEEAGHKIKKNPFQAVGIAFAVGLAAGALFDFIEFRRR